MPNFKIGRVTHEIKAELSQIIRDLKDPRISKMLSVVKVYVSNDMSHCKVYVSAIEGMEATKKSVAGLTSATGFIKREISKNMMLRKCPDLVFVADDSIEYGAQITKMLDDMGNKDE